MIDTNYELGILYPKGWIQRIGITSSWMWWLTPQMNKVLAPWRVAKVSIAVPIQIWYLTEASNWMPNKRNTARPLKIGRRSKARQASDSKPNRVATLKYLSCHLKLMQRKSFKNHEIFGSECPNISNMVLTFLTSVLLLASTSWNH